MAKRRQFTPEFKGAAGPRHPHRCPSPAEACRKHTLGPNLLSLWKATFPCEAHPAFDNESARSAEQVRSPNQRVLGRMTLENEILKKP